MPAARRAVLLILLRILEAKRRQTAPQKPRLILGIHAMLLIGLILVLLVVFVGTRVVSGRPSRVTAQRPVQYRRVWDRHSLYTHATREEDRSSSSGKDGA